MCIRVCVCMCMCVCVCVCMCVYVCVRERERKSIFPNVSQFSSLACIFCEKGYKRERESERERQRVKESNIKGKRLSERE